MTRAKRRDAGMTPGAAEARRRLRALADPARVPVLRSFFKTAPGEYGEGDVFIGVKVPSIRSLVRELDDLADGDIAALLRSEIHEERMLALLLMVRRFERGESEARRRSMHELYLANTDRVNSWDLVDATAPTLVGAHLEGGGREILYQLARSPSLWERRIAMVATLRFIRAGDIDDAFAIAGMLLDDPEDLLHKAAGWMLREAGKRDRRALKSFLERHGGRMPRTMLRYAIERFPEPLRRRYLRSTSAKRASARGSPRRGDHR